MQSSAKGLGKREETDFADKTAEPSQQRDKSSVAYLPLKRHVISQAEKDCSPLALLNS